MLLIEKADQKEEAEWIFRSYKQLAKINYLQHNYEGVLQYIDKLIVLLPHLNGNYAEESINKLLTRYSASLNREFVNRMFDVIISHLDHSRSSGIAGLRLWLKININRLNNALENGDWAECKRLIDAINARLEGVSELTRNSYGLEVIAAEIACVMKQGGDLAQLNQLYRRSAGVNAAITHPRVLGIVRECGATIQFYRKNYDKARVEFYESFKNYDEAGSGEKKKILKYLSLCSLLTENEVNPFELQETQTYSVLPEYRNLIEMVRCYENQDLPGFLAVVQRMYDSNDDLASDKIFQHSEKQILHNLKVKLLTSYLNAYSVIRYDKILSKLSLSSDSELEDLILSMANAGVGANVRINFSERYVESPTVQLRTVLPLSLDGNSVRTNKIVLDLLNFDGVFEDREDLDSMQIDRTLEFSASTSDDGVTVTGKPKTNRGKPVPPLAEEEEWLSYMKSALPSKALSSVSQKDQIYSEQQEDSKLAGQPDTENPENDVAHQNTSAGLLGSSIDYGNTQDEEEEEEVSVLDSLERWSLKLFNETRGKTHV